jgi:hypothetical protein
VLVSLSIFLFSLIAIAHLISVSARRAADVQEESRATQLAQSKLAEVIWGIEPLSSSGGTFDNDPDWSWSLNSNQANLTGLWNVKVTVRKERTVGTPIEFSLSQMVLDPSYRGSTFDTPPASADTSSTNASGSSTPATTTPSATTPAVSPAAGGTTRPTTPSKGTTPTTGGGTTRPSSGTTPTTGGTTKPSSSSVTPAKGP